MQLNRFSRLESLIGKDAVKSLCHKTVMIIGCGGVGGYVCEALTRSGIGKIILVDYDVVDITNINRQIIALNSTIGKKKVKLLKDRIKDINENCNVVTHDTFLSDENIDIIFNEKIDFVVDACDTVKSKKAIIRKCFNDHIPIISSMGTAKKMDPSKLEIIDISKTKNDPIARIIRKFIKDEYRNKKLMVLCSSELPIECSNNTLGSTAFVPSSAGLLIASYVIKKLIVKDNM